MRYFILIGLLTVLLSTSYAQKPLVTDTSYISWTTIENGEISPNGKYAFYKISNEPIRSETWVVLSTDKRWEFRSTRYRNLKFSPDGKNLYAMQGDSLIRLTLGSNKIVVTPNCKSYMLHVKEKSNWLIYTMSDAGHSLVIQNLKTNEKQILDKIQEYNLNKNGAAIVSKLITEKAEEETLQWTDLSSGRSKIIYKGLPSRNIIYDQEGRQMAFYTTNQHDNTEIWYYGLTENTAKRIACDSTKGIAENLEITLNNTWRFSEDGQNLFFNLKDKLSAIRKKDGPDIWNYQDVMILPQYKIKLNNPIFSDPKNLTILNVHTGVLKQLLHGDQRVAYSTMNRKNTDVIIVESSTGPVYELAWNKAAHLSFYLCITKTGELIPIKENVIKRLGVIGLSPDSRYLVYFDRAMRRYFSYNVQNRNTEIISGSLEEEIIKYRDTTRPDPKLEDGTPGIFGWIKNSKKLIIHGTYDLWELDLDNTSAPKNITRGFGIKNKIIFGDQENDVIDGNEAWLLSAFNMHNKDHEIYSFNYKTGKLSQLLKSATKMSQAPTLLNDNLKKASASSAFLLGLGNGQHSLNYVFTKDFKKLDTLSRNFPEKKYNWLTAELVTYKDQFGQDCGARLYKPENFDSTKRYPVIFYYYLNSTNDLNKILPIDPSVIGINIPLLVSNGYIICMPDIFLEVNKPGRSALKGVLAAVNYLKQFAWIDSTKMGIMGHSQGGFETNYIVTHSNIFAAASSGSGISNFVEYYNNFDTTYGDSHHDYVECCMVLKESLENMPDIYTENSPILATKNVTTPLLLMHNDDDGAVLSSQSKEFFVQLRSQQKPVWLVQYSGEGHLIFKPEYQIDYQNKIKSFFDHYLKNQPMPTWMNSPIK